MKDRIQKINSILGISTENLKSEGLPYSSYTTDSEYYSLSLSNVNIDDIDKLLPYLEDVSSLDIYDSKISSLSALFKASVPYLYFTGTFTDNDFNEKTSKSVSVNVKGAILGKQIRISNAEFDAAALKNYPDLKFLFLTNCCVYNLHELNHLPDLYQFESNKVSFINTREYIPKLNEVEISDYRLTIFKLKECNFDNINLFLPFGNNLSRIIISNSHIKHIDEVCLFPELKTFSLDAETVRNLDDPPNIPGKYIFRDELHCSYTGDNGTSDLSQLGSVAPCFGSLGLSDSSSGNLKGIEFFNNIDALYFTNCSLGNLIGLEQLTKIKELSFNKCSTGKINGIEHLDKVWGLYFDSCDIELLTFLPIAESIEYINLINSPIKSNQYLSHFKQLYSITMGSYSYSYNEKCDVSLGELLPLKNQLKTLESKDNDELENLDCIGEFTCLESLTVACSSVEAVTQILLISSLKNLKLTIDIEEGHTLDFSQLIHLENLEISTGNSKFTGLEGLQSLEVMDINGVHFHDTKQFPALPKLKKLSIECEDCHITRLASSPNLEKLSVSNVKNIISNKLEISTSLKELYINGDSDECHINGLEFFPNLEKLGITASSVQLGKLHQLKILDLGNNISMKEINCFDELINLEDLDLSAMYNDDNDELVQIENLKNLKKLKKLRLSATKLKSLDGMEHLISLEHLDLHDTGITDVSVLNQLPNLIGANLATGNSSHEELLEQLDNPEVAVFYYEPVVYSMS